MTAELCIHTYASTIENNEITTTENETEKSLKLTERETETELK